jgi:hypothetical protein
MNRFDQLVQDLDEGKLNLTHIQIAVRTHIRNSEDIPEAAKDVLCGRHEAYSGIIFKVFKIIREIIGSMELVYNRGVQVGREESDDEGEEV